MFAQRLDEDVYMIIHQNKGEQLVVLSIEVPKDRNEPVLFLWAEVNLELVQTPGDKIDCAR